MILLDKLASTVAFIANCVTPTGTIISLAANFLFFGAIIKDKWHAHKLKAVLSANNRGAHILTSENLNQDSNVEISFEQACSLSHISTLFNIVGKDVEIKSLSTHTESPINYSEICLGGPLDNVMTDSYIADYFPRFNTLVRIDKLNRYPHEHRSNITTKDQNVGFLIGNNNFFINDNGTDYFVLIKLDSNDLKENRSVIMIFGYTRKGLLCATKYLYNNYSDIYRKHKNRHFFIIGKCTTLTLQVDKREVVDLTESMFADEDASVLARSNSD